MTPYQFETIVREADRCFEGDGYHVNIYLRNGDSFYDRSITIGRGGTLCLERDDHPPVYVTVDDVVAVEIVL